MKAPGSPKRDSGPARPSWENLQAASSFVPPEPGTMGAADGGLVGGAGGYIGGKGGGKGFDRPFDNRPCYDFQKGMCNRTHCRFLHEIVNAGVAGFNPDFCPTEFAMAQPPRSLMPGFPVQRMQPQPEQAPQAQAAGLQFALPDHFKAPAGMTKQQMHEKSMNEMREREKNRLVDSASAPDLSLDPTLNEAHQNHLKIMRMKQRLTELEGLNPNL